MSQGRDPSSSGQTVVRSARDDDVEAIVALWDEAGMMAYTPDAHDDLARTRSHQPELVLVAEVDGAVAGTVTGTWDGRRGWIMRLAVAERTRRRGVGAALVAAVEQRLRARGATQINLLVFADNHAAIRFWQQQGYRIPAPVALMSKRLDERDNP